MSTVHSNQEKRSIRVKDFLDDFRNSIPDAEMLKKYRLTPVGLEKFYHMLVERGIVTKAELKEHYRLESLHERELSTETSSFICPCCLASHEEMFDICPSCGVSFQELVSRESLANPHARGKRAELNYEMDQAEHQTFSAKSNENPATVPPAIIEPEAPAKPKSKPRPFTAEQEDSDFMRADDLSKEPAGFDDSLDDIGHALEALDDDKPEERSEILCDSCDSAMQPGLRDIYDPSRTRQALTVAAICLVLGFFGTVALGFFDGFSLVRLISVYATALSFLFGAVFLGVGAFMFLARERVFFCPSCTRIYPRA
jgi:hypothetical protein